MRETIRQFTLAFRDGEAVAYFLAHSYAELGEKEKALDWLERAIEAREGSAAHAKVDPWLRGLHDDPRFQDLIRRMNFPD